MKSILFALFIMVINQVSLAQETKIEEALTDSVSIRLDMLRLMKIHS